MEYSLAPYSIHTILKLEKQRHRDRVHSLELMSLALVRDQPYENAFLRAPVR